MKISGENVLAQQNNVTGLGVGEDLSAGNIGVGILKASGYG